MWSRNVGNSKQENKSQLSPNKSQKSPISQIISFGPSSHQKRKMDQLEQENRELREEVTTLKDTMDFEGYFEGY